MTFLKKNSNKGFSSPPKQSAGILDDHAVRKALHTKEFAGNCKFVHGGMIYGGFTAIELGWTQAAAQNTWYCVSHVDITSAPIHEMTHDGSGKLTITHPGHYLIIGAQTFQISTGNKDLQFGFSINGNDPSVFQHVDLGTANKESPGPLTRILDLNRGDTVELAVRTTSVGNPTIMVNHISVTMVQIGGT